MAYVALVQNDNFTVHPLLHLLVRVRRNIFEVASRTAQNAVLMWDIKGSFNLLHDFTYGEQDINRTRDNNGAVTTLLLLSHRNKKLDQKGAM